MATPRDNNLRNFRYLSERRPGFLFGLHLEGRVVGGRRVRADGRPLWHRPRPTPGQRCDRIDPDLTIDALERFADRLAAAVRHGERVIVATGHPGGVLAIHAEVARAGCRRLHAAHHRRRCAIEEARSWGVEVRDLRYVNGVAMLHSGGALRHTHSPRPMEMILAALAEAGEAPPDLVVADHGWAGAAGQAGSTRSGSPTATIRSPSSARPRAGCS